MMPAHPLSAGVKGDRRYDLHPISKAATFLVFVYVATAAYAMAALGIAKRTPFWSDEVLAVWAARLPTVHEITTAIWHGAEFSPPTYDIFLHLVFRGFGSSLLVARMPSIVAVFCTAVVVAWITGRRLGTIAAALAFGLVLNSPLFDFAIQARPYAILIALISIILLFWSGYKSGVWRPTMIGLLLFMCMSLHVYAIVAFAVFALMEALTSARSRAIRPAIWIALAAAAAASAVWMPLVLHLSAFNSGDTGSADFYGAPTLQHLIEHFDTLFRGSTAFGIFLLAAILLIAGACATASVVRTTPRPKPPSSGDAVIAIMAAALLASFPVGFLLALGATHVFSARYALPAVLGAILLLVLGLTRLPSYRLVGCLLCALLAVLPLWRGMPQRDSARAIALLGDTPGPVVVSDSQLFMEIVENAAPDLRDRLVHLAKPPGVADGDTSSDHQLQRLVTSFRPDLAMREPFAFMAEHPHFTEVCRPSSARDAFCAWLIAQGRVQGVVSLEARIAVLTIGAGSHAEHP
jgi:uncharacterized membrane protein